MTDADRTEMPDVLARICAVKAGEIAALKRVGVPGTPDEADWAPRGFRDALRADAAVALIAEVKRSSPSAGLIREDFDPVGIARAYERGGAACVSVLTDRGFFGGEPQFLARVRGAVGLPLLRKEFILDEVQVREARALGADACLLIVAALEPARLRDLAACVRGLGMDALVEVHDEAELDVAIDVGADLLGINNRNLHTFEVDLATTERLARRLPEDTVLVAESGVHTRADVARLKAAGAAAVLVGESLMRRDDVEAAARGLVGV